MVRNCAPENLEMMEKNRARSLEIPGSRFACPGMTGNDQRIAEGWQRF
jgi:hypothetical protein